MVAERDGHAVGVAQLRRHSDGATELASLVVEPEVRGHGIAGRMVDALLIDEQMPVYTLIDRRFADHFTRWGFTPVDPGRLPRSIARVYRIGRVVTAVGSVLLAGGPLVLAFNNAEQNREDLSLAVSNDFGASWRVARRLEGESVSPRAPVPEYSYPWIMQDRGGDVHVLYTWGRSRIKHVVFNRAWLEGG